MKININEFQIDTAQSTEVPLDFNTLCALLAEHQAATPTARLARGGGAALDQQDHVNPAVAVLLAGAEHPTTSGGAHGSFHAAAAALFAAKAR
jgi:hypothetical protein